MSTQVSTAFVKQFGETVDFLQQQRGSKLRAAIGIVEQAQGEHHYFDQIDATDAQRVTNRHGDSPLISTPHARRRVAMENVEWGDLVDDFDKVRTLIDPTNAYTQNAAWAIGREIDEIIIENFFSDVETGKEGGSTTSFPAAQQVAVDLDGDGTDEGLTVEKLREARKLLLANNVDPERDGPIHIAVTAELLDDLLGTTEVTSADFNTVKALVDGNINTFMGFNFIHTELLETDSNSDIRCPVWTNNGMGLAMGMEPRARIEERADKRFSTYVYWSTVVGAVRLHEDRVVEIKCDPN